MSRIEKTNLPIFTYRDIDRTKTETKILTETEVREDTPLKIPTNKDYDFDLAKYDYYLTGTYTSKTYTEDKTPVPTTKKISAKLNDINVIGSSMQDSDICISDNRHISKTHCVIQIKNGRCLIYDTDSMNGTWVNDYPLEKGLVYELKVNDTIKLANFKLKLEATERLHD